MANECSPREDATQRLLASMLAFTRRFRATGQRWSPPTAELTRSEVGVLQVIADEGACRAGTIAARLCTGPSVVSRQLATLHDHGMVERNRDPHDGRAELLSLTPAGVETLEAMRTAYLSALTEQLADWDVDRLGAATEMVDQLTDLLALPPAKHPLKEDA